jgi:Cu/Ag efflux pump CusA
VLISLATIPASLVAAAVVIHALGETFNAISLAGLAAAVAVVVDDAVVGADNVARRLREHRRAGSDKPTADIVVEASREVRSPLAYATLIALLAIVPIAVMEGRPGAFFSPLALAYALAVAAAMVVALTLTPALSLLLFARGDAGRESPLLARLRPRYDGALSRFAARPRTALVAGAACIVVGLAVLPLLDAAPVPSFKDRGLLVRLDAQPGTSNPRMTSIATGLSRELRSLPGVENVGAHVGRAVTGDQIVDVNSGELWVSLAADADYDATVAAIERAVDRLQGVDRDVVTYSSQKVRDVGALNQGDNRIKGDDVDVLTGSDKPLVVRVYGQDIDVLRRQADRVRGLMSGVDGVVAPRVEAPAHQPTLEIEVDLDKARREAIKPGDLHRAETTLLQGIQVGSVFKDQKVFDVVVQGVPATRRSVASVRNLLIDRPGGGRVRLGAVADVRVASAPAVIRREAVSRRIDVTADVSGRSLAAVSDDIEARLANVRFPLEYHAEVLRETTAAEIGTTRMLAFALACAIASFLLLQAAMRSWGLAIVVSAALPVALVGGLVAVLLAGAELSLGSALGVLALLGLAVRNGTVLVRQLPDLGNRLGPVVTTAAALALLALLFVILGPRPGLEVVHPMAVVLLGGLVTTTFFSLFLLPALCLRFGGAAAAGAPADEELADRRDAVPPTNQSVAAKGA